MTVVNMSVSSLLRRIMTVGTGTKEEEIRLEFSSSSAESSDDASVDTHSNG
jgi:hypothetical protein